MRICITASLRDDFLRLCRSYEAGRRDLNKKRREAPRISGLAAFFITDTFEAIYSKLRQKPL